MADKCHIYLLGLIILCSLLTGMSGDTHVFSSSGEDVSLPCNNSLSGCTSTTWNYNRDRMSAAVELFAGGIKKNNIERHERLSLGSDCSLNIYKVTKEDYGDYTCRQFVSGSQSGNDTRVYLHVLQVSASPSSTQTEIRPGSSVTLSCQLFSYEHCDYLVSFEGIQLFWMNQAGVDLQTDSRYQILSSGHCSSTLTTTLLNEDNNTEWRCLVKMSDVIKTSDSYTVKFKAATTTTQTTKPYKETSSTATPSPTDQQASSTKTRQITEISKTTLNSTTHASPAADQHWIVIVSVIAALVLLLAVVLLWVVCIKRADRRQADNSVVTDENNGNDDTINISVLPTPSNNQQTDDVTYSEVITSSKMRAKKNNVHTGDTVTYAAIRGGKLQ